MKRFLLTLLTFALAAALVAFVLAPVALQQYRLWKNEKVTVGYRTAADALSLLDCGTMLAQAQDYNRSLQSAAWMDPYAPDAAEPDEDGLYASLLNPMGDGVMAILEIPKLGASLAVYHGDAVDSPTARVEHAPQSRLPSGSADGPCILRVARERFFDPFSDLDRLIDGDCFFLRVLQETTTYEVFQVALLSSQALNGLEAVGDEECALVAETAAGMRLVVRGRRVPRQSAAPVDDSRTLPGGVPELILAAPLAAAGLVLLAIIEMFRRALRRRKRRRTKL